MSHLARSAIYFDPKPSSLIVGKELSRGAYGAVHSGLLDGKDVAVKRVHGLLLDAAKEQGILESMLDSFRSECRLLERVNHPHVVDFKGAFYDETTNEPLLVMELMSENLRRHLEQNRGRLSRQKQLEICISIVRGLRFLHTRAPPVLHRDLTDKNILLALDGLVKIGDLGQSRLKTADYFSTGQPGAIPFMPPEAMQQQSHYNEKLDIFSLGVLMLEIATQQPPRVGLFGIGTTPELQRRREDLSKLDEDHPLRHLILSCLKDDPKERPDIVAIHLQLLALVEGVELQLAQSTASRPTQEVHSLASESDLVPSTASRPSQEVSTSGSELVQSTAGRPSQEVHRQTSGSENTDSASSRLTQEDFSPASSSETLPPLTSLSGEPGRETGYTPLLQVHTSAASQSTVTPAPDVMAYGHFPMPLHTENVTPSSLTPASVTTSFATPSPPQSAQLPVTPKNILAVLNHRLDAKWRHFGTFLSVEYQIMEAIQRDKGGNPADCMLDLLGKWTTNQVGTGTLPRTWQTVVEAVQLSGDRVLAQYLAKLHGGPL